MGSPLTKRRSFDRATVIQEVTRGYELTTQLQSLIQPDPRADGRSELAEVLFEEVLHALTATLSILKASPNQLASGDGAYCSDQETEGYDENKSSATRDQNRRHKKRELVHLRREITTTPYLDCHQWRKYGEKNIRNSNGPRQYYRCTNRDGQQCQATKRVEQMDCEDPPKFLVTYINQHTCKTTLNTTEVITDPLIAEPCLLSFGSSNITIKQEQPFLAPITSTNQECSIKMISQQSGNSLNHPISLDLTTVRPSRKDETYLC